jgi:quinol-cytochrome oxidoreductase complex cytochrome b subunit
MKTTVLVRTWIEERFDVGQLIAPLRSKTVPRHRFSVWYFLGGVTLFLFFVQVFTGLLLLLYYRPSTNEAYESVQYIIMRVQFGWLVRSVHFWSANLMIFMAFAHMFSVVFLRSYRKPRELTWVSGMVLLFLGLGFGFSGYLLPWNTLSYFATKVGTEVAGQVPLVGHGLLVLMRGGEDVAGPTLARFFSLHVVVLPALAVTLLMLHLWLVQKFGMSVPPSVERRWTQVPEVRQEVRFLPDFLLRDLMAWCVMLTALLVLASVLPAELGHKADPFAPTPLGIKPEWYFLAQFQTLRLLPAKILGIDGELLGVLGFGLAGAVWLVLPLLESRLGRNGSRWVRAAALLGMVYLASLTLYAYFAK